MIRPANDNKAHSIQGNAEAAALPSAINISDELCGVDSASLSQASTPAPAEVSQPPVLPDLIPVRMLNEFTYCRRLGYLEFVHGEWEDNLETKQGTFGHRRVDKPDRKNVAKAEGGERKAEVDKAPHTSSQQQLDHLGGEDSPTSINSPTPSPAEAARLHARSIMLSAPVEGLIAKLDLMELDGNVATPVDYKRGRAPKVPEGAYEPERVQVCAQGLVLRENGFQCNEGVLYFIESKKRVVIPFDEELVARTRQLLAEFRHTAAGTDIPAPLVDSPKCPRCSLVGICLPDEVTFLRNDPDTWDSTGAKRKSSRFDDAQLDVASTDHLGGENLPSLSRVSTPPPAEASRPPVRASGLRMLLAARDNALPFYVQDHGVMLGKSGDRLQVKKRGTVIGERRLMDVSQVSLFGSVMMSAQALTELTARGIPICHFSYGGWFHGITTGLVHKNVELRIRQYALAADETESVKVARQLISGKIRNCRTLLRRHLSKEEKPLLEKLERYRRQAEATDNNASLLGIEGMAAKTSFEGLFRLMNGRHAFDVNDRNRRPPRDPVNAVLSFAYALLTKELTVVLQSVGFDPMLGVFHQPRYGRPSLALDLAEEYRPLIADSVMITAFNNGELTASHFLERAGACVLTPSGRSALIACFERRMTTEITHPIFGYKLSYRRLLEVQARLLSRTILGELEQYPTFTTR